MNTSRRAFRAAFVLLCLALSRPAAAQSNGERVTNDRYTRSHDYDLIHQAVDVRNFDWDSTSFDGEARITAVALRQGLDSLILDAGALLRIDNVMQTTAADRSVNAQSLSIRQLRSSHHGDTLVVHLRNPVSYGDTLRIAISYHGKVENGRGLTFIKADGRPHRPQQIWSQGEDMDNHLWFPTYDFPNDKATWEVTATVPKGFTAVSNGNLVTDRTNADGTRTMHWSETKPNATYLVSLVVAPLVKVHDMWRTTPVDYYVYAEDQARAMPLFHITTDMIEAYSTLTGVKYPWEKYAQTTVADFFGGMENVSATTLVDWLPDDAAYVDRPWYQWILIPHELAHQWFGDYVTTEDWAHTWLNEGFAEYMPGAYWRLRKGEHTAQDYFVDEYNQFMAIDRQQRMPVVTPGSNNIYPKGALVIEMLRNYLGDEPFWSSIHHYLASHAMDNATTDDLRQAILDRTGQNLDWFFDQWLYQAGYPEFHVETKYDAAASRLLVIATQTQSDTGSVNASGVRFTTPQVFRMPVAVRVGTANGDVVAKSWIDQRTDTIVVDNVRSEPNMVIFDDGNHILKTLDFPQPVQWLTNQLAKDQNLWDRQWVIGQLSHSADAAAGAAIANAASNADYFLTRVQAVQTLGTIAANQSANTDPAGQSARRSALRAALADTSAQVRAAAVEALGRARGADAADAIRGAARDRSYAVRAAAVTALVRADSSHASDFVREAMKSTSYRDVIRNAALLAAASTGDPSLEPDVAAMIGEDIRASIALGRMAARGDTRASQRLVEALNDARDWVRGWAISGITQMPRPTAISTLQAARASLRYADTRDAVDDVIRQLQNSR